MHKCVRLDSFTPGVTFASPTSFAPSRKGLYVISVVIADLQPLSLLGLIKVVQESQDMTRSLIGRAPTRSTADTTFRRSPRTR
jgi:hypothetical protein